MLAAVYHGRDDVRVQEWPAPPPPPPGWVTVAPTWCGICGTDIEELTKGPAVIPTTPLVMGHEGTGRVVRAGDGARIDVGSRVSLECTLSCCDCEYCFSGRPSLCERWACMGLTFDGALAELVNVPAYVCLPVDDRLPDDGAALGEPLAVCVRAVRRSGGVADRTVRVVGGGAIGALLAQVARHESARKIVVVDPSDRRRAICETLGLETSPPSKGDTSPGAEVVFECSGSSVGFRDAAEMTLPGGVLVVVGIHPLPEPVDLLSLALKEKTIVGTNSHTIEDDFVPALEMLASGAVAFEPIVTDRIRLSRIVEDGFTKLVDEPDAHMKILVSPNE